MLCGSRQTTPMTMSKMKYLALDFGLKRVGIAVSDAEGRLAFPRPALVRREKEHFWQELLAVFLKEEPQALVIGLPLLPGGGDSLTTRQARNFTASLKRRVCLPLFFMPEELSSYEAEALLREAGTRKKGLKNRLDSAAAARILESFLAQPFEKRMTA